MKIHEMQIEGVKGQLLLGNIAEEPSFKKYGFNFMFEFKGEFNPKADTKVTFYCHLGDFEENKHFKIETEFKDTNLNYLEISKSGKAIIRGGKLIDPDLVEEAKKDLGYVEIENVCKG